MVMMIGEKGSGRPSPFTDMFLFEIICSSFDLELFSDGWEAVKRLAFGFCLVHSWPRWLLGWLWVLDSLGWEQGDGSPPALFPRGKQVCLSSTGKRISHRMNSCSCQWRGCRHLCKHVTLPAGAHPPPRGLRIPCGGERLLPQDEAAAVLHRNVKRTSEFLVTMGGSMAEGHTVCFLGG